MPAGCNCGPNSPLGQTLGCHCLRHGTAVIASQLPLRGCKAPLFKIVSGAISSELALPFYFLENFHRKFANLVAPPTDGKTFSAL